MPVPIQPHFWPYYKKLIVLQIITRDGEIFFICLAFKAISLYSDVQCHIFYVTRDDLPIMEPTIVANPFNSIVGNSTRQVVQDNPWADEGGF